MIRRVLSGVFLLLCLGIALVLIVGPQMVEKGRNLVTGPAEGWPVSPEAQALHDRLLIGDWHADSLLWDRDLLKRSAIGHADIPRLAEGNVAVQVFSTVTKSPADQNYDENATEAFDNITPLVIGQLRPIRSWFSLRERALDQAARLHAAANAAPEKLVVIRNRTDLRRVLDDHVAGGRLVGGILATEGAHPLEGDLANLDVLYDAGFRVVGLTHFFDNDLGGSLHGTSGAGLTPFGRQVVARLVEKRMIIDLAHASPQAVRDVLAIPGTRPIISHTGIFDQCRSPRNYDDEIMQAVARKGGLIGIGYWSDVVCGQTPGDIADAITAAVALVGEDHVSLGSDFDGSVDTPFDAATLAVLTHAMLDRDLSEAVIAKVMGGNMMEYLAVMLPQGRTPASLLSEPEQNNCGEGNC